MPAMMMLYYASFIFHRETVNIFAFRYLHYAAAITLYAAVISPFSLLLIISILRLY